MFTFSWSVEHMESLRAKPEVASDEPHWSQRAGPLTRCVQQIWGSDTGSHHPHVFTGGSPKHKQQSTKGCFPKQDLFSETQLG